MRFALLMIIIGFIGLGCASPSKSPNSTPAVTQNSSESEPSQTASTTEASEVWEVVQLGGASLAVPKSWRTMDGMGGTKLLRIGDGIGLPPVDEIGGPLQVGIAGKQHGSYSSLEQLVTELANEMSKDPKVEKVLNRKEESVQLCGNQMGSFVQVQFDKGGTERRSLYQQVAMIDRNGVGWSIAAFIVASRESRLTQSSSELAQALAVWPKSLCAAPDEVNLAPVRALVGSTPGTAP